MIKKHLPQKKILIIGAGYVGTAYACFFSKKYHVDILDIDQEKIDNINKGRIFSNDSELLKQFAAGKENIFGISLIENYKYYLY